MYTPVTVWPSAGRQKGSGAALAISWGSVTRFVLIGLAIVGAPTCSLFVKTQNGAIDRRWFGAQMLFVALAAAVPAFHAWRLKRADVGARTTARLQISYTLNPILRIIATRTAENPKALGSEITSRAVEAAAAIIGPGDLKVRSCYYELEAGPPKRLVLNNQAGRDSTVLTRFEDSDGRGKAAITMVETNGKETFCVDVGKLPPPDWKDDGDSSYKTFISLPVVARGTAYGMLTVDAPQPGDLTEHDVSALKTMAELIAVSRTIADKWPVGGQQ
jgi:hypothetical protein